MARSGLCPQVAVDASHGHARTAPDNQQRGRLAAAVVDATGGGGPVTATAFAYNHAGHRVRQTLDDGQAALTTHFLVDDNNFTGYSQVLEEKRDLDSDGQLEDGEVVRSYTVGDVVLAQSEAGGATLYLISDGHGSTRLALDLAGQPPAGGVSRFAYDAYGNALGFDASLAATSVLYSGQLFDKSTALQFLRARYYDAAIGAFSQDDPFVGDAARPKSLARYTYSLVDPVNYHDPDGKDAQPHRRGARKSTENTHQEGERRQNQWKTDKKRQKPEWDKRNKKVKDWNEQQKKMVETLVPTILAVGTMTIAYVYRVQICLFVSNMFAEAFALVADVVTA